MTNTEAAAPTVDEDPRPMLARALDQIGRLVSETDPASGSNPTPCTEYDVATLINHLQAVVRRLGALASGQPFWTTPREIDSTDWAGDWAAGRTATDAALAAADLDLVVELPWGQAPVRGAMGSYIGEMTIHAWDLAVATDRTADLDPELAVVALPGQMAKVPADRRGGDVPFGPVVEVPADAPAYDRLVGWDGRNPAWSA